MKKRCLLEFTVDVTTAAADLTEMITAVLAVNPGRELEILHALDEKIGLALAAAEGGEDIGIN
ncbi:hypothetical protein NSS79_34085 [Paenibacillus sp. FSL L8-0436]|uniref:hypothetical protein n=1 Tax=Paenibacillus sp. FSL L8-0436 TaxID=2954686 RepID=UPI0031580EB6